MTYPILDNLKPRAFFKWFGEICKIPHATCDEKNLALFIVNYAKERGYEYKVDAKGNIYMQIPPSAGYEDVAPILIQSHMDMVWRQDEDISFDYRSDSLRLVIKDGDLYADGTTLGADNGVGVAAMLAVGDDPEILHPMLEFIFTVEEETGLHGIREFDMSLIKSRRMINTDSGNSHMVAVSSLGKISGKITKDFSLSYRDEDETTCIHLEISGGLGGHAGLMSRAGRSCAGYAMGCVLAGITSEDLRLYRFETLNFPILTDCNCTFSVPKAEVERTVSEIKSNFAIFKEDYKETDPGIEIEIWFTDEPISMISKEDTRNIISLINSIRTKTGKIVDDILISHTVVRAIILEYGSFFFDFSVSSAEDKEAELLFADCENRAKMLGFEVERSDGYPGWRESKESQFRDEVISAHKKLFGYEPAIQRVLGGIEVGVIAAAIPDMDAVAITPTKRDVHTTKEHLVLNETEDFWNWLIEILKAR